MSYELDKGCYTGIIKKSFQTEGVMLSTTRFYVGQNEGGLHSHKNPIITFIYQGGDIEYRQSNSYERKAGEFFYYPAGQPHKTISRNIYSQNLNIEFDIEYFSESSLSSKDITSSLKNIDSKFLALKLLQEVHTNDSLSSDSIDILVYDLISKSKENLKTNKPKWVDTLSELLNSRWQHQISLNELSAIVGVHAVTISKQFRKYFNCTYGEYMRKLKVKNSIELVKNSDMPLIDIAYYCGFADHSHFTRNFKCYTGFLPKVFRNL